MGFDQYHEPADELSQETRTFARMITSLIEEAEAIGWYEQRMSLEKDKDAKAIMANAQKEQLKHFGMNLEFLLRRSEDWRTELKGILFTKGDIVKLAEEAEKKWARFAARLDSPRRVVMALSAQTSAWSRTNPQVIRKHAAAECLIVRHAVSKV